MTVVMSGLKVVEVGKSRQNHVLCTSFRTQWLYLTGLRSILIARIVGRCSRRVERLQRGESMLRCGGAGAAEGHGTMEDEMKDLSGEMKDEWRTRKHPCMSEQRYYLYCQ